MAKSTAAAKDPGTVLKMFLDEYQLNPSKLGKEVQLSQSTIRQITLNKMKISIPIALRFSKFFGNPVDFWIDLQTKYSLAEAAGDAELNEALNIIGKVEKPAPAQKAAEKTGVKKAGRRPKTSQPSEAEAEKPAVKRRGRKPKAV